MSIAELVPIDEVRGFDENPKQRLGKDYAAALDASINDAGFSGSMVLTPRCSAKEAPALARVYGDDGRFVMADGNARLERIRQLGYRWVLVLPQPDDDGADGTATALQAILAAGAGLLETLKKRVRPGDKVAFGRINPRLTTPERLKRFVLGFDRARAKFDEDRVASTVKELVEKSRSTEERDLILTLNVRQGAVIRDMLAAEKRRKDEEEAARRAEIEAAAAEAATAAAAAARAAHGQSPGDGPPPPEPEAPKLSAEAQKVVDRKAAKLAARRDPMILFFSPAATELVLGAMRRLQSHAVQSGKEGRIAELLERGAQLFGEQGLRELTVVAAAAAVVQEMDTMTAERRKPEG